MAAPTSRPADPGTAPAGRPDRTVDGPAGRAGDDPGRPLRALAACDESILQACPEDRFLFSGFGAVMLGTAVLAATSMTLALAMVFRVPAPALAPIGGLWGLFVLGLDRLLVASGEQRLRQVLPRLVVAGFFGLIIAEPIVLRMFDDAVSGSFATQARTELAAFERDLERCNPPADLDTGRLPDRPPGGCDGAVVAVGTPAAPALPRPGGQDLAAEQRLAGQLDQLDEQIATEQRALESEVAGSVGAGLSGQAGSGPASRVRRDGLARLEARRADVRAELARVRERIRGAEGAADASRADAATAATTYNRQRDQAIRVRLAERERDASTPPGLAQRMDRLTLLMGDSHTILLARVLITAFFVVIDMAPVLMRLTTRHTTYHEIRRLRLADRLDRERVRIEIDASRRAAGQRTEQRRIARAEAADQQVVDLADRPPPPAPAPGGTV